VVQGQQYSFTWNVNSVPVTGNLRKRRRKNDGGGGGGNGGGNGNGKSNGNGNNGNGNGGGNGNGNSGGNFGANDGGTGGGTGNSGNGNGNGNGAGNVKNTIDRVDVYLFQSDQTQKVVQKFANIPNNGQLVFTVDKVPFIFGITKSLGVVFFANSVAWTAIWSDTGG
jgi:hypothetical protein